MYHSVTLKNGSDSKNTWSDWHLIPTQPPHVSPPKVFEKLIEVPGRDGALDLTSALTGSPTFGNRSGSWDFHIVFSGWKMSGNKTVQERYWTSGEEAYETILQYLRGRQFTVSLEDEAGYEYNGRVFVQSYSPGDLPKISLSYNLNPYRVNPTDGTRTL